ncbi:MAG: methionyl-tRNA formyltransferase [Candidatus Margulisbacteria bacterium]|nr:methionyl-tRNA formyltransferase [Candidatus Margulisiibacteriota bacterium]
MQILFMGTPDHAAGILQALLDAQENVAAVITQPDRPKGRGQKLSPSPVKLVAMNRHLPVEQPEKAKDPAFVSMVNSYSPELIVAAAYGKILPKAVLDIPKYGCINVHASLLPKYRGAAPIQWAILNGEIETGITIMQMAEELDAGDIILQKKVPIDINDNTATLGNKLFEVGQSALLEAIDQIKSGKARRIPQKASEATFAPSLSKESGEIDWKKKALEIHNRIRAMNPWPGAHTFFRKKRMLIWGSCAVETQRIASLRAPAPGRVMEIVKNKGLVIATGDGLLLLTEVQLEGGKRMNAYNLVIGHKIKVGDILPS